VVVVLKPSGLRVVVVVVLEPSGLVLMSVTERVLAVVPSGLVLVVDVDEEPLG